MIDKKLLGELKEKLEAGKSSIKKELESFATEDPNLKHKYQKTIALLPACAVHSAKIPTLSWSVKSEIPKLPRLQCKHLSRDTWSSRPSSQSSDSCARTCSGRRRSSAAALNYTRRCVSTVTTFLISSGILLVNKFTSSKGTENVFAKSFDHWLE